MADWKHAFIRAQPTVLRTELKGYTVVMKSADGTKDLQASSLKLYISGGNSELSLDGPHAAFQSTGDGQVETGLPLRDFNLLTELQC